MLTKGKYVQLLKLNVLYPIHSRHRDEEMEVQAERGVHHQLAASLGHSVPGVPSRHGIGSRPQMHREREGTRLDYPLFLLFLRGGDHKGGLSDSL